MSMDASLKAASALVRHRNVLTRAERLTKLKDDEKWREGQVLGLPKVAHRKAALAKVVKEEVAEGAAGAAAPAAAAAPQALAGAGSAPAGDTLVVRIQGEDQYRLSITEQPQLEPLDGALSAAIERQDTTDYTAALANLLNFVRSHGVKLAPDALVGSDVMLPSEDMTIEEATALLAGNGNVVDAPTQSVATP